MQPSEEPTELHQNGGKTNCKTCQWRKTQERTSMMKNIKEAQTFEKLFNFVKTMLSEEEQLIL